MRAGRLCGAAWAGGWRGGRVGGTGRAGRAGPAPGLPHRSWDPSVEVDYYVCVSFAYISNVLLCLNSDLMSRRILSYVLRGGSWYIPHGNIHEINTWKCHMHSNSVNMGEGGGGNLCCRDMMILVVGIPFCGEFHSKFTYV